MEDKFESNDQTLNFEYKLDDEAEADLVHHRANNLNEKFHVNAMPFHAYAERKCLPFLYEALQVVEQKRPANPIEYFAYYLLANNPNTAK